MPINSDFRLITDPHQAIAFAIQGDNVSSLSMAMGLFVHAGTQFADMSEHRIVRKFKIHTAKPRTFCYIISYGNWRYVPNYASRERLPIQLRSAYVSVGACMTVGEGERAGKNKVRI